MLAASFAASSAVSATPSLGTGIPYASQTSLPSGAVSDVRPSAFALSSTCRTAFLFCAIVVPVLDHVCRTQRGDIARAVAQFLQNFVGVLAEER